jgi:hypothetical protein
VTASHVDGVAVIAVENARSSWKDRKTGEHLEYRQMLKLLLEDGREVYGCLHCDYTHPNLNSVRPHLNKHRLRAVQDEGGSLDLVDLARRLQRYARLEQDRDRWRTRALDAERELRRVREVLGGLR